MKVASALLLTAAQIEAAILDAQHAATAREADVAAADAAYIASLDQGRDAAFAARARLTEAKVDRDIALRLVERLGKDLEEARKAEATAEAEAAYQRAGAAQEAFQVALERDLPAITDLAHGLLRLEAEALVADEAARAALSRAGGEEAAYRLPPMEDFRISYGRGREEISRTVKALWVNEAGQPPSDEFQARIVLQADGTGRLQHHGSVSVFRHRRTFVRTEYRPADLAKHPGRLAETLSIPALRGCDEPGWRPRTTIVYEPYPDGVRSREVVSRIGPSEVLERLQHLESQRSQGADEAADFRAIETKFEPEGDLYEVSLDTAQQQSIAI